MGVAKAILLAVRFLLELSAFAALGFWGFTAAEMPFSLVLALGAPLAAIALWGLFVSPKARFGSPLRQALGEAAVFGAATVSLLAADQTTLAVVFAAAALIDGVLLRVPAL